MTHFRTILLSGIAAVTAISSALHGMELFKDGQWRVKGIAVRPDATTSETFAAQELRNHAAKVTGQKPLPIFKDNGQLPEGKYIYLGNTLSAKKTVVLPEKMEKNYGEIHVKDGNIYILGKDQKGHWKQHISQGTLFAVYDFLEQSFGVRWLWPDLDGTGTYIPKRKEILVPDGTRVIRPLRTASRWRSCMTGGWENPKNKTVYFEAQNLYMKRHRFSVENFLAYGHAFTQWYDQYGKEHPEFFNLLPDGTRRPNYVGHPRGNSRYTSLCAANPELAQWIVKHWAQNPRRSHNININENDSRGLCVCDTCLTADDSDIPAAERRAQAAELFNRKDTSWFKPLGQVSGRYARLFQNVYDEASKIDPEVKVFGLIYANYTKPPKNTKLNSSIILRYCPAIMYPWQDEAIDRFRSEWKGWAETGAKLVFRPNFTLDGQAFPIQYHREFFESFRFAEANGMIASDMDACTGCWATQGLVNYIVAQLNHDRTSSLETLENEFYQAFGPAKGVVREYFEYLTKVTMKSGFKDPIKENAVEGGFLFLDLFLVADTLFTDEVMEKCESILAKARAVKGLDKVETRRVEMLQAGLKNARLLIAAQREFRKYKKNGQIMPFVRAVDTLDKFRASIEPFGWLNMGWLRYMESRHWPPRHIIRIYGMNAKKLDNWVIRFDPEEKGLRENWQAANADWQGAEAIGTDSHWEKQPAGIRWKEKHGRDFKGVGWYRVIFDVENPDAPRELVFGSVDGSAVFYLNGEKVWERPFPYKGDINSWRYSFKIPVSGKQLKKKGNVLTVRVEKRNGLCGIWQPVFLAPSKKSAGK